MPPKQRYKCAFCKYSCISKELMKHHVFGYHEVKLWSMINKLPFKLHEVDKDVEKQKLQQEQ